MDKLNFPETIEQMNRKEEKSFGSSPANNSQPQPINNSADMKREASSKPNEYNVNKTVTRRASYAFEQQRPLLSKIPEFIYPSDHYSTANPAKKDEGHPVLGIEDLNNSNQTSPKLLHVTATSAVPKSILSSNHCNHDNNNIEKKLKEIKSQNEILKNENMRLTEKLDNYMASIQGSPVKNATTTTTTHLVQPLIQQQQATLNMNLPDNITNEKYEITRVLTAIDYEFSELKKQVEMYQASHGTFVAFGHITCIETVSRQVQQLQRFIEVEPSLNPISLHVLKLSTSELMRLASSYKTMIKDCFMMYEHGEAMNKERKQERHKLEKLLSKVKERSAKDITNYQEEIKALKTSLMKIDSDMKKSQMKSNKKDGVIEQELSVVKKELQERYLGMVEELKVKVGQVSEENVQVKTYCRDLEMAIDKWNVENHKLRELVGQMKKEIQDLSTDADKGKIAKEQCLAMQVDLDLLQTGKLNLEKKLVELETNKKQYISTIDSLRQEVQKAKECPKQDDINVLLQAMIASNLVVQKQPNGEDDKLEALIKLLSEEKNKDQSTAQLNNLLQEQKSNIEKLSQENLSLKAQILQLKKEYKAKQDSLAGEINKIQTEFSSSQQEFIQFEAHLNDYERQHRDIVVMLNTLSDIGGMSILKESIESHTKESKGHPYAFASYFNQLQSLYVRLKQENQVEKSRTEEMSAQDRSLKNQNEGLQLQLKNKQEIINESRQQLLDLQRKCEELDNLKQTAEEAKAQLQMKLQRVVQGCKSIFAHPLSTNKRLSLVPNLRLSPNGKSNRSARRRRGLSVSSSSSSSNGSAHDGNSSSDLSYSSISFEDAELNGILNVGSNKSNRVSGSISNIGLV